jgi:GNAT superfamily N-acetyltransferase
MGKISYVGRSLLPEEYLALRAAAGWPPLDYTQAAMATRMDLFSVVVLTEEGEAIGGCRVLGDGVTAVWLHDLVVAPKYRRRGVGSKIVELVFTWLAGKARPGLVVGCLAAPGTEPFFARLGFAARPADAPGMHLVAPLRGAAGSA